MANLRVPKNDRQGQGKQAWLPGFVAIVVLAAVAVPYLVAFGASGEDTIFLGFLQNPVDGHTYLAKMYQGWEGNWRYRMAFSQEPGAGAFLFPLYLGLGHISRVLRLPLINVFHSARLLATGFMLFSLYLFFKRSLPDRLIPWAFTLSAVGSGLGWLAVPFGAFTADLWVSEGYPFLSGYTNPHFPFSLGLMTWILTPRPRENGFPFFMLLPGLLLALILPFGLVIVLGVLGVQLLLSWRWQDGSFGWLFRRVVWLSLGGVPAVLYELWLVRTDPIFAGWNAQNITVSPPPWELLISFSPALLLALYSIWRTLREQKSPLDTMVIWLGVVLVLIYLPLDLQRRLLTGFYIPVAGLAVQGLDGLSAGARGRLLLGFSLVLVLSLPTNLIVLLAARHGIQTQDPQLYMSWEEGTALEWIRANTDPEALVLAGPELGLFIPGQTGRRVIYGHPFETVNADQARAKVLVFFEGNLDPTQAAGFLSEEGVDYIFYGPRERDLGALPVGQGWDQVYREGEVEIYAVSAAVRGSAP